MEILCLALLLFLFFTFTQPVLCADICSPAYCNSNHGPGIRFPFRLIGQQPKRCGYPGFDLTCNNQTQTILNLPLSGEYVVDYIDYTQQAILINDPDNCVPKRILNFSLSGSPYEGTYTKKYTFLNCSSVWTEYTSYDFVPLFCLSGENYTVLAISSYSSPQQIPVSCHEISHVSIPPQRYFPQYWSSMERRDDFQLTWDEPGCRSCEANGGICGLKGNTVLELGCSRPPNRGLPRSAKYGIIIGIGIPGLLCLIGLACYAFGRIRRAFSIRSRLSTTELPTITISQQPVVRAIGLDGPTIASYPKTVLGESRRLPKPNDGTCPICLSDYEPKETLRSIPDCNHYFHANCIDEWLKLNGTCPVCRNSPESSIATPCSSMSSSYSLSSSDHH